MGRSAQAKLVFAVLSWPGFLMSDGPANEPEARLLAELALTKLPRLHEEVMRAHYGLNGHPPRTAEEIAKYYRHRGYKRIHESRHVKRYEYEPLATKWEIERIIDDARKMLREQWPPELEALSLFMATQNGS